VSVSISVAISPHKIFCLLWQGEMQNIAEYRTSFFRINLVLSEAAAQALAAGARRARRMATSKRA